MLRVAFAQYSDDRAKTSISRAWSTWNQFLAFCVSDGQLAGNPMAGGQSGGTANEREGR